MHGAQNQWACSPCVGTQATFQSKIEPAFPTAYRKRGRGRNMATVGLPCGLPCTMWRAMALSIVSLSFRFGDRNIFLNKTFEDTRMTTTLNSGTERLQKSATLGYLCFAPECRKENSKEIYSEQQVPRPPI